MKHFHVARQVLNAVAHPELAGTSRVARSRIRALSLLAALVASAVASLVATGSQASASSSKPPITIGMSLPMTGPVADVSKSGYQGYELWAQRINQSGGLLGRNVKLDMLDDGFDPNQDAQNYLRLITQDHVNLLLGTFSSLLNADASAVAARQGMLYVEPSGGDASLFTRGFKDLFLAQPGTSSTEPEQMVAWIKSLPKAKRPTTAAYVTADDPSAAPAVAVFKTELQRLGIKTVYNKTYDTSTTNFDSIASGVVAAKPQMIIQGAVAQDGSQFVQALEQLSYTPKVIFQTNAPSDSGYASAVGGAAKANGIFTAEAWDATATYPGNQAFIAAYKKRFGSVPTEDAANSYTAGQVVAAAVRAVGSLNQKALAVWLHTHSVSTIVGKLKWNKAGDPGGALLLAQWQNGTLQLVAPKSVATSNHIINPKPRW
jgi:branched-chain amino acid transport system substrate-binding protein